MMHTGWSSGKKKVDIGRLIDWLVGIPSKIPSLRGVSETKQSRSKLNKS